MSDRPGLGCQVIAIGCSWGGVEALSEVLGGMPFPGPASVVVAQHRGQGRSDLAGVLSRLTGWVVCDAEDKMALDPGTAYLAPPGYHLLVEPGHLSLSTESPVSFSRPSADVLFDSAAAAYGPAAVGVVLTGANHDGAVGLAAIVARGGRAVVQDPATAVRAAMPAAALASGVPATVLPLDKIGPHLGQLCAPAPPAGVALGTRVGR